MKKSYTIGHRFNKWKYAAVIINSFVVFTFYFIYSYLFFGVSEVIMALIFVALGVLIAKVTVMLFDKYAFGVVYTVTDKGLSVKTGRIERLYLWEDFKSVSFADGGFQNVFPVEFKVKDEKIMLNQYLDDLCRLTRDIFEHIKTHVDIPPDLIKRAEDMTDVY